MGVVRTGVRSISCAAYNFFPAGGKQEHGFWFPGRASSAVEASSSAAKKSGSSIPIERMLRHPHDVCCGIVHNQRVDEPLFERGVVLSRDSWLPVT